MIIMKIMLWKHGIDDGTTGELPHIGLAILARDMKNCGHDPFIIDNHFDFANSGQTMKILTTEKPDLLCISLVSQEWLLDSVQEIINIAVQKKIPVWLGGPHIYGYWDLLENDDRFAKIIIGEADGCFEEILNSPDRIIHLKRSKKFMCPDFKLLKNHQKMITYPVYVSRGCKFNCSFCAGTKTHGNRWRPRKIDEKLWQELDSISVHFPKVHQISVIDDAFSTDLDHAKYFLKEYIRRKYPYPLTVFNVRADQIDLEFAQLLKQVGTPSLAFGIESGDVEVFKLVRKGESLEMIRKGIAITQQVGIKPWLNMVIGLPGDSPEAHAQSMKWVLEIPRPWIIQWLHFAPYRNTWAYDYFVKQGDIEDGYIPWLQGGRFENWPENGIFDAKGFSRRRKMLAQLDAYLRCNTPVLILNDEKIRKLCEENELTDIYRAWRKDAPIREFVRDTLPHKVAKGQINQSVYEQLSEDFL